MSPLPQLISVALCCNDDRGNTTDRLQMIHIDDIDLELDSLFADWGPKIVFLKGAVRISGKRFACHGRASWVGNIYWEAVNMAPAEVCRLLNWARGRKLFDVTGGPVEIGDAWDSGEEITVEMLA